MQKKKRGSKIVHTSIKGWKGARGGSLGERGAKKG